ncbi:unnamed protein product [Peronospora effusa]|nr:unnamed protein product [Peronospora effusa]
MLQVIIVHKRQGSSTVPNHRLFAFLKQQAFQATKRCLAAPLKQVIDRLATKSQNRGGNAQLWMSRRLRYGITAMRKLAEHMAQGLGEQALVNLLHCPPEQHVAQLEQYEAFVLGQRRNASEVNSVETRPS